MSKIKDEDIDKLNKTYSNNAAVVDNDEHLAELGDVKKDELTEAVHNAVDEITSNLFGGKVVAHPHGMFSDQSGVDYEQDISEIPDEALVDKLEEKIHDEVENQKAAEQEYYPLFIGTPKVEALEAVLEKLKNMEGFNFEIVVMSRETLTASVQNWFFERMRPDEQKRILAIKNDNAKREEALKLATELKEYFCVSLLPDDYFEESFRMYELKSYFRKDRTILSEGKHQNRKLSTKDVREIMDFLNTYGFLTPTTTEQNFEKQRWIVTVDTTDRLKMLQKVKQEFYDNIESTKVIIETIDQEIGEISLTLEAAVKELEALENTELLEGGANLEQSTDHLNDRGQNIS